MGAGGGGKAGLQMYKKKKMMDERQKSDCS